MSFAGIVGHFKTAATYTVTRRGLPTVAAGIVTPAASSTFSIVAVAQPARGNDLKVLPEGRHGEDVVSIHTTTALRIDTSAGVADTITVGSSSYVVIKVEAWTHRAETFYRVFAARVGAG